ncbi:hypothetical protein BL107_06204 [Synechococcus sp. BL107]|nr:hypothetical protein BL107_06204 [Synechococcus sp. BL107]
MDSNFILDPTPAEWIDNECNQIILEQIFPCHHLLDDVDMLKTFLRLFIRQRINQKYPSNQGHLLWAREFWGHRLDQLFLECKDSLDQASCRLIRVSNQGLAFELYHRLSMGESTFEQLSMLYGEGSERFKGGAFELQNMEEFPSGIQIFLKKLKVGQTTKPLSVGNMFAILQLIDFIPCVRSPALDQRILQRQFDLWLNGMSDYLYDHLKSIKD